MPYASRKVLPGFPKEFVFECREDVDAYLGGDRITCLLCGQDFKALGPHINGVHEMNDDAYRERYGLPYRRGLISTPTRDKYSEHGSAQWAKEPERYTEYLSRAKAAQADGNPQRGKPQFWKNERTQYALADYEEFVRRVMDGATVSEVAAQDGMPAVQHVYWYMKRDKEFAAKYRAVVPLFRPRGTRKGWKGSEVRK